MTGYEKAVAAAKNASRLAELLGISRQAVSMWEKNGIPVERCPDVKEVTGVPLHELRPDIFPAG